MIERSHFVSCCIQGRWNRGAGLWSRRLVTSSDIGMKLTCLGFAAPQDERLDVVSDKSTALSSDDWTTEADCTWGEPLWCTPRVVCGAWRVYDTLLPQSLSDPYFSTEMLLWFICTFIGLFKVGTVIARFFFLWAFSDAVSGAADFDVPSDDGAETNHVVWCCWWGQVFQSGRSVSASLMAGGFYILTPSKMTTSGITISANSARLVQRALFCYKRVIGLGADLHGDMPDLNFYKEIDAAISEVMASYKKRQQVSSAKRQTAPQA